MGFLDKLTEKTSEVYKFAKEKTVKVAEGLKLKNKISNCNDKINKEYEEIGKIVYEKVNVNEDASKEEINPKCEEISKLKEEIEKAEVEILALKDIKKCNNCGEELSSQAEFCSKCGKEQPKMEKVEVSEETEIQAENAEVTEVKTVEDNKEE